MLTKEAKEMLFELFQQYRIRRQNGDSRASSRTFHSGKFIHENYFPDWNFDDVEDTLRELGRNGYLKNSHSDNHVQESVLTDFAITKMENQKADVIRDVLSFIAKFIP